MTASPQTFFHGDAGRSTRARNGAAILPLREPRLHATPKVSLQEISLSYKAANGKHLLALDKISLQVQPGEFLCIVGPSGCGKSTLLHLIAGLHHQTSGQILVDGKPVAGTGTYRILIFQELGLFPCLTVKENDRVPGR